MHRLSRIYPLALLATLGLAGCDAAGPGTAADATTLSVQVLDDGRAASLAAVDLSEVKLLLNAIRFGSSSSGSGSDDGSGDDHGGHGGDDGPGDDHGGHGTDDGAGHEFELEDINRVVRLDLSGAATPIVVEPVPAGTYSRVTFQIHKPEDSEPIPDADFRDGESGNQRYSVIVRGTVEGQPFELKVSKSMQERIALDPPLVVGDGGRAEVMLLADVGAWFVDGAGRALDPRDPSDADAIADRIAQSFRALSR